MKKSSLMLFSLWSLFNWWGCANKTNTSNPDPAQLYSAKICADKGGQLGDEQQISAAQISQANNALALALHRQILKGKSADDNVFLSSYSLSMAFAMLQLGSAGETQAEICQLFGWPQNSTSLHKALAELAQNLQKNASDTTYTLQIANRICADANKLCIYPNYAELAQKYYNATPLALDFSDKPKAAKIINDWASQHTNGKIPELYPPNQFPAAVMILANAIYFKADWHQAFDKRNTAPDTFHAQQKSQADFMNGHWDNSADIIYHEAPKFKAARFPYKGKQLSMLVLLPNENSNIQEMFAQLDAQKLDTILQSSYADYDEIIVKLPKWKTEYTNELSGEILPALGMTQIFKSCNLGNMTSSSDLQVSSVLQKTFIAVDEKGTEAAAVTAIAVQETAAVIPTTPVIVEFIANRPFVYCIVDNSSNAILFMGQLTKP